MKRLFGTDGIRAVAGEPPLDRATVRRLGVALARILTDGGGCRVVLGRDTRESGPWLRDAVAAGLRAGGAEPVDAGVLSTPGLAHAVQGGGFHAGVMISASHNPFHDNGIKVFAGDGAKLSDEREQEIEAWLLDRGVADPGDGEDGVAEDTGLLRTYLDALEAAVPGKGRFRGLHVVLDCANGSACDIAPEVFRHHGARVSTIGARPDGRNINLHCGSLHLDALGSAVRAEGADVGLAFDGDADRCLAVDRSGRVVDGDHVLFITGRRLKLRGRLRGDAVVATIMSNYWLEEALDREGIGLRRAAVGDKYVLERMIEHDLVLGGEQSGHVIFREMSTTGDGILTGLLLLDAVLDGSEPLERILDGIEPYPQMLLNVDVRDKPDLLAHPTIGPVVREVESALRGRGRVVLRYSGTEPVARVMVEGRDAELIRRQAEQLAAVIRSELGR